MKKIFLLSSFLSCVLGFSQFTIEDKKENLQDFDTKKYSWGFFINGIQSNDKIVLNPQYGIGKNEFGDNKNLVLSEPTYSFGAGLIGKMRINDYLDLRLEPGLQFIERNLTFDTQEINYTPKRTLSSADKYKKINSTTIDVPLLLEFHIDRWFNSRPYIASGVNWLVNLQSNQYSKEDNLNSNIFRSTTHNLAYSAEIGIQFYFYRFKLTPAFRGTFTLNNELVKDNPDTPPYWASALNSVRGRSFMFVLKFE